MTTAEALLQTALEYARAYGFGAWAKTMGLALGYTLGLFVGWRFLRSWRRKALGWLEGAFLPRLSGFSIQGRTLVPAERVSSVLTSAGSLLTAVPFALLVWFYMILLFGILPQTQKVSLRLVDYILDPLVTIIGAALAFVPNLFFIAVVVLFTHYLMRLVSLVVREVTAGRLRFPGFYPEWAEPTFQIARFLAWSFALVVAFPYLPGAESPAFKGVSVFLGVLLSLGSGSAVANAVAGIILTYMRPFRLGDRVRLGGTTGDVLEKTLLVIRLRTNKGVDVTIPNALVLSSHIENFTGAAEERRLILHTTVTIGYDAPWPKVHALLRSAAEATEGILKTPSPFVLQTALGDYSVAYELNAYTADASGMVQTYSHLHENIQDRFNEAGVEIMSPSYLALRDGNAVTLPAERLPAGYRAPGFRINPDGR